MSFFAGLFKRLSSKKYESNESEINVNENAPLLNSNKKTDLFTLLENLFNNSNEGGQNAEDRKLHMSNMLQEKNTVEALSKIYGIDPKEVNISYNGNKVVSNGEPVIDKGFQK